MIRNLLGSLLALIGAAAAVYSPFRPWYDGRLGRDFRIDDLFTGTGVTSADAALFTGLFVLMLVVAVIAVLGVLLRSRLTVTLAGVLGLGVTVLWMVRQGQAAGSLTAGNTGGLASGAGLALGGALLLLLAGALMTGRRTAARRRHAAEPAAAAPPFRGAPDRTEDTLEQPFVGPPPPERPYADPRWQQPPGPGAGGAPPPPQAYPGPPPPEPGPPPPEPGAPPPQHPYGGPRGTHPEPPLPEGPEPYEPQPGTQGAPLDEPYEQRRPGDAWPPAGSRRPGESGNPDDEDTWPHRGRDAA
ncbi:hypothetical protein [Streptomyces sp. WMMB303]|uniref:hypothetical protein n=1 Tax=Streptomyces sp. WMMB303 TaxID=3034154 RepID=UPI0023EAD7F7|nr:hypothetical protein [Streptomyces sp. WMMB303]MDF4251267.1 hypothetical protein [Streptomyces sp. WMMB303]